VDVGDSILSIAASPAGVAVGISDKIVLLEASGEQKFLELEASGENGFVAFNSDGSMLAAANSSGQVRTWQQENGSFTLLHTLKKEQPYSIAFHPDGTVLAVATVNNVYLIDTLSGEELSRIPHKGIVYNVSFSPDGTTMATASLKVIQLWDVTRVGQLRTADLIKTACSRLIRNFSASEWTVLFGDQTYIPLCENLPVP
jgi:WD40 repeat protein